jgi:TonB family protein
MRTAICNVLLMLLLIHAAAHGGLAADETLTFDEIKGVATFAPRPRYPYEARSRKQAGSGVVNLVIDPTTGRVKTAEMAKSTGWKLPDDASLNAFRAWRFKPGSISKAKIPITFVMGGPVVFMAKVRTMKDVDEALAPFLGRGTVLHAPQPRYPWGPPWTNKEGKGIYEMHVGKDGKVEDVNPKNFRRCHL